jgi:hypothetical protein
MTAKPKGVRADFQPMSFLASQHPGLLATTSIANLSLRAYITGWALGGEAIRLESLTARPEGTSADFQPMSFLASQHPGLLSL